VTGDQAAEARPATVNVTSHVTQIDARHVWTDDLGVTHGSLDFGDSWIVFHDPAQVREVAAKLSQMADAMDAEIARAKAGAR
jgi:uncharacterized protein (DUF885 family)